MKRQKALKINDDLKSSGPYFCKVINYGNRIKKDHQSVDKW